MRHAWLRVCRPTGGSPLPTQRRPKLIVNKVPMRRICEILDLNPAILYGKLRYLAEGAREFTALQERRLGTGDIAIQRAYMSVDRQDHLLNWGSQLDRRYAALGAVGAAENDSGYVLTMQLNFDADCNAEDVEADAIARGDYDLPPAHRHYARLWLRQDRASASASASEDADLDGDAAPAEYRAPPSGMQVKIEVLYFAVLLHLKRLLAHAERTRFFLDLDPALDSACIAAFKEEIRQRRCDVFLVKTAKDLSVDKKRLLIAHAEREVERFAARTELARGASARLHFVEDRLRHHMKTAGPSHAVSP